MSALLDRDLVYVTGKGGVGKSTVAVALALAAAARGRRAVLCEVAEQTRLGRLLGREDVGPGTETEVADDVYATSIDPQAALEEWLATQIGGTLVRVLSQSRAFSYFVAAAPGAKELVTITKAWELAQPRRWDRDARGYDLVVVDAPASGHGIGMLRTPRTFADLARVGPIRAQADRVSDFLRDPARAGYLAVATPEEMPVSETLELEDRLPDAIGRPLDAIVLNGLFPRRFTAPELERVGKTAGAGSPAVRAAGTAAGAQSARVQAQQGQLRRLRRGARAPVVTLPFLFRGALDRGAVGELALELAAGLP